MSFLSMRSLSMYSLSKHSFSMRSLLVFSIMFIGIGSILSSVCLFSCSSSVKNPVLLSADSLMETHPDSALSILESISSPQKLTRAERAYYAVLLTQAKHKNYIPLEDDSLIKTAVEYYGDRKKSINAARAHYYLGATYREKGNVSFAVEQYMKALKSLYRNDKFNAIIYDNLAECYEDEGLYAEAMKSYRKSLMLLMKDEKQMFYPLRGIAHLYLLQNQLDSALYYMQKAYNNVLVSRDSTKLPLIYSDLAAVYYDKGEYNRANDFVSKAIPMLNPDEVYKTYHLKGHILIDMDMLDSAHYCFDKNVDRLDIYGKSVRYDGLYQLEKKKGNWKAALDNVESYLILYDSIQELSYSKELDRLMDNYQLENHKKELSRQMRTFQGTLIAIFFLMIFVGMLTFLWCDRKRKKKYISLQHELVQKRVDVMLLKDEVKESEHKQINNKLSELRNQQLNLCISIFQSTESFKKLEMMKNATPKQLLLMHDLRPKINNTIREIFIDVMANLKECCPALTNDDLFYCVLLMLNCSKNVIMELMNVSSDALKTRKNRIKNKMEIELFKSIFESDNQG